MTTPTSDVRSVEQFGQHYQRLKREVNKVIIGQDDVRENGALHEAELPVLVQDLRSDDIARHQVGSELDAVEREAQCARNGVHEQGLGQAGNTHQQAVSTAEDPQQDLVHHGILADEINRTPPKTQAALLEAMQEKSVTAAGQTHRLPDPFFVLATQNPIEQEGTYPLPEAQLDRFMFNIWVDYPTYEEEVAVVKATTSDAQPIVEPVLSAEEILHYQGLVRRIPVPDNVLEYAVKLVSRTRPGTPAAPAVINDHVSWGAGPRASQYLVVGAKAHALAHGRFSPDIADVQAVATSILRHRLVRNYKAEAEGVSIERLVKEIL